AALVFNRSNSLTYSAVISGTGTVTKLGAGTLTLTGDNTYTGATTISVGALQIGNGGTSGSISGDITDNASLIFNRSDNVTFSGAISGGGIVTKRGGGTLTLTNTSSYSGGTTVEAGTLSLGVGAAAGTGPINLLAALDYANGIDVANQIVVDNPVQLQVLT